MSTSKLLLLFLLISFCLNLFLLQRDTIFVSEITDDFDQKVFDTVYTTQSAVKKNKDSHKNNKYSSQQKWLVQSSEFFKQKLGLSDHQIMSFHSLKSSREQELNAYIIPKINAYHLKYAQSPYIYSMQDSVFIGRLNEKYMARLKKLMGQKNFKLYESFKNSFNRKLISLKQDHKIIDF